MDICALIDSIFLEKITEESVLPDGQRFYLPINATARGRGYEKLFWLPRLLMAFILDAALK